VTGIAQPFPGKVRLLGAVIDPQTRLGSVRVDLEPDPNLRPGAFARAAVQVGFGRRPILPQSAVLSDADGTYVIVARPDDTVARRAVSVSGSQREGLVIDAGLDGSERVVLTAGPFLRLGEKIVPTALDSDPTDAAGAAAVPPQAASRP
jgi:multidrug efflux pump subunit AcrA (membrane-fusion protein)